MSRRPSDDARNGPGGDPEELSALLADLSTTLEDLRATLDDGPERGRADRSDRRADRPSAPRSPRPRTLLRYAEREAIPTVIAVLEANVRALESLRALLRLVDGTEDLAEERDPGTVRRIGERTADRLDRALAELDRAVEGEPPDSETRELLAEARALGERIDERVTRAERRRERRRAAEGAVRIGVDDAEEETSEAGPNDGEGSENPEGVDVDAELDSLRRQVRGDDERGDLEDGDGS
ncbi:hypothetical protein BRC94_10620 [Halobacteriales archaeon QS_5_70_17]|nr:MAG: hypothetical protein BRC94_10620 [Halobacteriales archaeon QS_5_70_17]